MPTPLRVLMIEDSETDANLILRQLQRAGYTVEYLRVESAAEMQAALDEQTWQIITADYSLPQFDAPSALALLQKSGLDIPLLVISGEITEEMAVGLMKAGAQDYLMKNSLARLAPVLERELTQVRKRREHRGAEERHRMLVNQAVDGIFIADTHGNFVDVNPSECAMFGYKREEILKLNVKDLIAPADLANESFHLDDMRAGTVLLTQRNMIRKDGSPVLVEISGKMLADGQMQGVMRDITERKRVENELRWLNRVYALTSQVNQMVVRTRDPREIYSNVCRLAIEYGKFRMAWIGLVDEHRQMVVPVAWEGEERGYLSIFKEIPFSDIPGGHGPTGMSVSTKQPFFCNDIANEPPDMPLWRDEALQRGYRASIALPIIVQDRVIGAFTLYSGEPFLFNPAEIHLLQEVTGDIAFALEMIENEQRRIQAEESLHTTLQQLSFHIENTPLAVVQFDTELRISYWSARAREMFGWKAEEALGQRIDQLRWFHEQDAERVALQRMEMLATRKTSTIHTNRNYRKNGSVLICQWYDSALLDPHGGLISLQSQILDISERVHAEDAMRESEEKFRLLVDQSPSGIVILNQQGLITGWNRAQEKIYGVKKAEVVGKPGWDVQYRFLPDALRTPEQRQKMKDTIRKILVSGQSPSLYRLSEFEIHRPDGIRGWVETTAFVVKTNEGYISVTTSNDISERRLAVAKLKDNAAQLELVFNSTSDAQALFKVEPGERFIYQTTNRPYWELVEAFAPGSSVPVPGMERKEYLATLPISMEVFERELVQYRRVLTERRPVYFELEFSIDGINVALETSLSPVLDDAGECSHLLWSARNISERKRIQEELRESNERFSNAFEFAANGMALTAMDGRWLKVNQALADMVGYSIPELLNMNYREVTHPDDLDVDRGFTRQILAGEINRYQLQKRFIHRCGEVVWVLLNISMVRDEQGQPLYAISQMSNISELKRAEETLHLQSAALEYAANAIVITDRAGTIQWVNPAWSKLTGYPAHEVIGLNPRVLNSGQQDQAYYRELWDTILRGDVWQSELVNKRKDGSLSHEGEIITPVRDERGEITHFVAIKQDITERKLAEEMIEKRIMTLTQPMEGGSITFEELFNLEEIQHIQDKFAQATGVASLITHVDGSPITAPSNFTYLCNEIIRKNARGCANCMRSDAAIGRYHPDGPVVQPCLSGGLWDAGANITVGGHHIANWLIGQVRDQAQTEEKMRAYAREIDVDESAVIKAFDAVPAMSRKHFEEIAEALFTLANQLSTNAYQNVQQARFITERKRAEEALLKAHSELEQRVLERTTDLQVANQALEKAARLKDEFLASMSHELRTPLTGILGLSEAMQMVTYGELNDRQRNAMKNIENSGRHLLALINDILDLSKIEAGRLDLQIEACSLGEICQSSLQMSKGMASQKRQQVHFHMEPASILLKVDARRLKQMMVNLLSNAIKFTPEGGSLGIEVRGIIERKELRIVIWDDGIGIQPEDQARLFQPFVQLDSSLSRQYAGTGLGLSLVQRLADMHNGHVEVESSLGHGSRFTIVLPWLDVEMQPEPKVTRGTGPLDKKIVSPEIGPLVLVADDNEVVLEMISDFLESRNYRVGAARSGPEFLECLDQVQADIILMDIQMPGMDGIEVLRRIRAHPDARTAALPVIAVTALAMAGDRERCLEAGVNAYLSKPVQLKELIATIQSLCPWT